MHQTQNARLDEIMKRSKEQFTYITQILSPITEGKLSILNLMKLLKKGPERQLRAQNSQANQAQEQVHQQRVHYNDR